LHKRKPPRDELASIRHLFLPLAGKPVTVGSDEEVDA
jgi:hypothetical protein